MPDNNAASYDEAEWNEAYGTCVMKGIVKDSRLVHDRCVRVRPVEHHYEDKGEKPYIKYGCPVCEALGNMHQLLQGVDHCMLCGVKLAWEADSKAV